MAVKIQRDGFGQDEESVFEVTYEGRVLSLREMNGYHDSDFYALVWDDETGKPREIEYATTRGWTYGNNATVDADDETLAKYEDYLTEINVSDILAADRRRAELVERGKTVTLNRTVRTRKNGTFEKGETGTVFWLGEDRYSQGYGRLATPMRAGVDFGDGRKHFFAERDLTATVDESLLKSDEEVRDYARAQARRATDSIRSYRKVAA